MSTFAVSANVRNPPTASSTAVSGHNRLNVDSGRSFAQTRSFPATW